MIYDAGNLFESEDVEEVIDSVETAVRYVSADGKVPILLGGGEHSITVGALRNFRDCGMIIVDAHSDFRDSYMGSRFNHACVTRRALELLGPGRIVSVGTRSVSREEFESEEWKDVRFITADEVRERGGIRDVIGGEIRSMGFRRVYFSIDMDGIDPAYAPGVGTPEPFGLTDRDVRELIGAFAGITVAFDIVEITPVYDNGNTSVLAAKFIQEFIGQRERKASKNHDFRGPACPRDPFPLLSRSCTALAVLWMPCGVPPSGPLPVPRLS